MTSPDARATDGLQLVADIGGTNARFALTDLHAPSPRLLHAQSLDGAAFASLQHAVEHYLAGVGVEPSRAAFALACPVHGDEIRLTNRAWSFKRHELQQALGLDQLLLFNDFGAVATAAPALHGEDRVTLQGPADAPLCGPVSVLGPGTGFGVGLLVGSGTNGWNAVETEGGHAAFAPLGEEECAITRWLDARHGRTSYERVLSGDGLAQIDAVLRGVGASGDAAAAVRDPADIVALALQGDDADARNALARFCAILGSVAGDIALIHGARTVMIAGGIVPRFIPFLRGSAFLERFRAKGRFAGYLESVSLQVVTHANPGLLGAAVALRDCGGTQPA